MPQFKFFLLLLSLSFNASACELGEITLDTNFANATSKDLLSGCTTNGDNNSIILEFQPENTPINNSPWYAFKLTSKRDKTITVKLAVKDGKHRYVPKLSYDGMHWQVIDFEDKDRFRQFDLKVSKQPVWIAGQELITNADYINWGKELQAKYATTHQIIGQSVDNRPIYQITANTEKVNKWLVILGRQHPPEITGAMALFPFTTTVLSESELAQTFRKNYNILIVPNVNPDGVELGYWRHNKNGVDLNRDWNKFKQPEVVAIDNVLTELTKQGDEIAMAVDFHSTHKDIFYTMPNDYGMKQPYLVNNWLDKLDKIYPHFKVIQKPGNNPDRGVFKQYVADKFGVHAITYEMGDNTDRAFIDKLAIDAANTLMKTMLKDNDKRDAQ